MAPEGAQCLGGSTNISVKPPAHLHYKIYVTLSKASCISAYSVASNYQDTMSLQV